MRPLTLYSGLLALSFTDAIAIPGFPTPFTDDVSCDECLAVMSDWEVIYSNDTNAQQQLAAMQQNCSVTYPHNPINQKTCEAMAAVYVEVREGIADGLYSLAWDIPVGVCATFEVCDVQCCEDNVPQQVHLSFASNDRSLMGVAFVTLNGSTPRVQYRESSSGDDTSDWAESEGQSTTYHWGGWVGQLHSATMGNLKSNTAYTYRVTGDDGVNWSKEYEFKTLKEGQEPLACAVIADMGYGPDSDDTIAAIQSLVESDTIQCVIHSGDISYADGFMQHWDLFFNKVEPIASRIPYMVTPGNHEFWYNFSAYKHRFYMPGLIDEGGSGDNMYYAWKMGPVQFLALDSETAIDTAGVSDEQIAFIERVLSEVDRDVTPWIVAHFHRPLYCSNSHENCETFASFLRNKLEDIFKASGVDLVLSGHMHDYERSYPVYQNVSTQRNYDSATSPVYVLQGASGNREHNSGFPSNLPEWNAGHSSDVGFGLMTFNSSTIDWKFYSVQSGVVQADSFIMTH